MVGGRALCSGCCGCGSCRCFTRADKFSPSAGKTWLDGWAAVWWTTQVQSMGSIDGLPPRRCRQAVLCDFLRKFRLRETSNIGGFLKYGCFKPLAFHAFPIDYNSFWSFGVRCTPIYLTWHKTWTLFSWKPSFLWTSQWGFPAVLASRVFESRCLEPFRYDPDLCKAVWQYLHIYEYICITLWNRYTGLICKRSENNGVGIFPELCKPTVFANILRPTHHAIPMICFRYSLISNQWVLHFVPTLMWIPN